MKYSLTIPTQKIEYQNKNIFKINDLDTFEKIYYHVNTLPAIINTNSYNFENDKILSNGFIYRDSSNFVIIKNDNVYTLESNGFETIKDYIEAEEKLFIDSKSFYNNKSEKLGFKNLNDFYKAKEIGFSEESIQSISYKIKAHLTERELGFVNTINSHIYESEFNQKTTLLNLLREKENKIGHFYNLIIVDLKFKNLNDFIKGIKRGFGNGLDYYKSIEKGFIDNSDYILAMELNLNSNKFYEIKKLNLETKEEIEFYFSTREINENFYKSFSELNTIVFLNNTSKTKISIEKLYMDIKNKFEKNKPKNKEELFFNKSDLIKFLSFNKAINLIGEYDQNGEYFNVKNKLTKKDRKVYIDGSNIAHNGNNKVKFNNIKLVIDKLEKVGFDRKDIHILSDASLKHKLGSKFSKELDNLENHKNCPAEKDADEFIINNALEENGLIITNDRFREYREKSVNQFNISQRLITFTIIDELVTFANELNYIN